LLAGKNNLLEQKSRNTARFVVKESTAWLIESFNDLDYQSKWKAKSFRI
jgi:hypothetical protein